MNNKILFWVGLAVAASGIFSPAVSLALGLAYGLTLQNPYQSQTRGLSRFLLQASVVGLGFGMNLHQVIPFPCSPGSLSAAISLSNIPPPS